MKERIISGIAIIAIVACVLCAGYCVSPFFVSCFLSCIGIVVVYELFHNVAKIKSVSIITIACIYNATTILMSQYSFEYVLYIGIAYGICSAFLIVLKHNDMDITKIGFVYGIPIPFTLSLCALNALINHSHGLYYLLLMFGFSSVCDIGAYFTGTLIGKHKLCPNISPKKTIEGAVGGIVVGIVFATVIMFAFDRFNIITLLLSVPFCLLGIIGDLFASVIKRSVGLKDFGNLIPGHGGVLDRIDSILMIAPTMFLLYNFGII